MSISKNRAKQKVKEAIEAIDSFSPPDDLDPRYHNNIRLMRRHLVEMLASLETEGRFLPVKNLNMGWVIVDSWPREYNNQEPSALARLGSCISEAEYAYQRIKSD
jgi:hypothetical protein